VTRREEEAGNKVVRIEAKGRWAKQEIVRRARIVVGVMLFSLEKRRREPGDAGEREERVARSSSNRRQIPDLA
jgi:hypothetical protein